MGFQDSRFGVAASNGDRAFDNIGDLFMTTLPRNRFVTTTKELTVSLKLSREKFRLWQKSHN
jgi:hypothetical protein